MFCSLCTFQSFILYVNIFTFFHIISLSYINGRDDLFSFSERSTVLKHLNSHGAKDPSEGDLIEGEENVRPILFH